MPESVNAERDTLRAALDSPTPVTQPDATQSSSAPSPEVKPEAAKADNQDSKPNLQVLKKPDETPGGQEGTPTKPETDYSKAKRGRERLEDIRLKAEAEKTEARRERETLERIRGEFKQELSQRNQGNDGGRFSPQEFARAADWYDSEAEKAYDSGDIDAAKKCRENAKATRRAAYETAQREGQSRHQSQVAQFARTYGDIAQKIIDANPDLNDSETEASKEMVKLLESEPILTMIPDGFKKAYEILQLRQHAGDIVSLSPEQQKEYTTAGKAAGLLKTVTELKAEVERLNKLTSLEKGSPQPLGKSQSLSSLPLERQREILRARAEANSP